MRLRSKVKSESIAEIVSASSSSYGDTNSQSPSPGGVSSHEASTSHHEQNNHEQNNHEQNNHEQNNHEQNNHEQNNHEQNNHEQNNHEQNNSLQKGTPRKVRGRTVCKDIFSNADPSKKIRLVLDKNDQAVGESAAKLSSACGVVARISTLCPITYNNIRHLFKDMQEPIMSYMKERVIISSHKEEKFMLNRIGNLWNNYKSKLRQTIYKADGEGKSKSEIHANVPFGVEPTQWIQFVDYWLTEEAIERSNKHKAIRRLQKSSHTTGRKSYATKRKEMEDAREREVGAVEFFRETHISKNGQMKDSDWDVMEKCNALVSVVSPQENKDRIHLENEVMLEVQGPEHSKGAKKRGFTSTWFGSEPQTLNEEYSLDNNIISLTKLVADLGKGIAEQKKREAELAAHNVELEKNEAELVERNAELEKREAEREQQVAELEARNAELEKRESEREQHVAELVQREAERDVEFNKLKQMLEAFMHR